MGITILIVRGIMRLGIGQIPLSAHWFLLFDISPFKLILKDFIGQIIVYHDENLVEGVAFVSKTFVFIRKLLNCVKEDLSC